MRPTTDTTDVMALAFHLATTPYEAMRDAYDEMRPAMAATIERLHGMAGMQHENGLAPANFDPGPIELPADFDTYRELHGGILDRVLLDLMVIRSIISADVFCMPLFLVITSGWTALTNAAFGRTDEVAEGVTRFALKTLGVEAGEGELHRMLVEAAQSLPRDESGVHFRSLAETHADFVRRVLDLWQEAAARDGALLPVTFDPYYSCFVSYSTANADFAEAMVERLKEAGVQTWFAGHDMRAGRTIRAQIDKAMTARDKVLLVVSAESMNSEWVRHEIESALRIERESGRRVLFPIRLAGMDEIRRWQVIDPDSGSDLAKAVRNYFIPDFSGWTDPAQFETEAGRLIDDLRRLHDEERAADTAAP